MDKNARDRIMFLARTIEAKTKAPGKRNGAIGYTGLKVLGFLVYLEGPLRQPSIKAIARATQLAPSAVCKAKDRLVAAGILIVENRKRKTALGIRQMTNVYHFLSLIPPSGPELVVYRKKEEEPVVKAAQLSLAVVGERRMRQLGFASKQESG